MNKPMSSSEHDEFREPLRPRRRGIYVLPNAVTLAALFAGFYGIVAAINGRFEAAAIAVLVAMVAPLGLVRVMVKP